MFIHDLSIWPKNSCYDLIPNPCILANFMVLFPVCFLFEFVEHWLYFVYFCVCIIICLWFCCGNRFLVRFLSNVIRSIIVLLSNLLLLPTKLISWLVTVAARNIESILSFPSIYYRTHSRLMIRNRFRCEYTFINESKMKINTLKYHGWCTDEKISFRINLLFYLYFPPSSHLIYVCFCPVGLSLL